MPNLDSQSNSLINSKQKQSYDNINNKERIRDKSLRIFVFLCSLLKLEAVEIMNMVENRKRAASQSRPDVSTSPKMTRTKSVPQSQIEHNGTDVSVDTYESLYNDPDVQDMNAHEKLVFNLGLDFALEHALESFDSMISAKQEEMSVSSAQQDDVNSKTLKLSPAIVDTLPFNIENKYEFFSKLKKNRAVIRRRTRSFRFPLEECLMCNFKTESKLVMDSHLAEPHNMSTLR